MLLIDKLVRWLSVSSICSRSLATCKAKVVGMDVKSDTTSNDTITSFVNLQTSHSISEVNRVFDGV